MQTYKPTSPAALPTTYRCYNIVVTKQDWDEAQRIIRQQKHNNSILNSEIDRIRKNRNEWRKHAQHLKQKLNSIKQQREL